MNSLFWKLLLWFLAAIILTGGGFIAIYRLESAESAPGGPPYGRIFHAYLAEGVRIYERSGRDGLERFFGRLHANAGLEGFLTDATGRDLLTGEDHSELLRRFQGGRRAPLSYHGRLIVGRPSDDRTNWLFYYLPPWAGPRPLISARHLWVLGCVLLLSYALARHLTSPLRDLENAVERLGRGDFTARINSRRSDELGRLASAFDRMAGRIQSLVGSDRRLLADISHELRSPLTRLGVAIELARSGENLEASLNRIEREAARLNTLVGGLLEVTRGEVDPSTLRREHLLLDDLARETVETCRLEVDAHPCVLELSAPAPVPLRGDPELLRRALENVLRNAIRYSPPSETVSLEVTAASGGARVLVRDRGPGVPEASLPNLFDAFYRVEADRNAQTGGFGLGLSIARRAVELHGGRISARNVQPGLAVEILLPVQPA